MAALLKSAPSELPQAVVEPGSAITVSPATARVHTGDRTRAVRQIDVDPRAEADEAEAIAGHEVRAL